MQPRFMIGTKANKRPPCRPEDRRITGTEAGTQLVFSIAPLLEAIYGSKLVLGRQLVVNLTSWADVGRAVFGEPDGDLGAVAVSNPHNGAA